MFLLVLDEFAFGGEWQLVELIQRIDLSKIGAGVFPAVKLIGRHDRIQRPA
jgi:hypothetical protein